MSERAGHMGTGNADLIVRREGTKGTPARHTLVICSACSQLAELKS